MSYLLKNEALRKIVGIYKMNAHKYKCMQSGKKTRP